MASNESELLYTKPGGRSLRKSWFLFLSLLYLIALAAAEYITYEETRTGGAIFHLVILFSLAINSGLSKDQSQRRLWLALGLVSVIRFISIATPVTINIPRISWYIAISIPIIAGIIAFKKVFKYSLRDLGINGNNPILQVLVAIVGIFLGLGGYFLIKPEAWTNELTIQTTLIPALVLLIFTGLIEEAAFRGIVQRAAASLGGNNWVYVAAIYTTTQIGQKSLTLCVFAFVVNLFFGLVVKKTGSVVGTSLAHGLVNIGLYLIFPHLF
jgi:uncharacterized protein